MEALPRSAREMRRILASESSKEQIFGRDSAAWSQEQLCVGQRIE
jgi:hypothetical protein